MKRSSTLYVGLDVHDVHKESIAVAYVSDAKDAEVLYLGSIGPATRTSISSSAGSTPKALSWCLCMRPAHAAIGSIAISILPFSSPLLMVRNVPVTRFSRSVRAITIPTVTTDHRFAGRRGAAPGAI